MLRTSRNIVLAAALLVSAGAFAQTSAPGDANPKPQLPPGDTLSEKLDKSDGVITPPPSADNAIQKKAPAPDTGAMPVIPPPGSPGSPNQSVDPK